MKKKIRVLIISMSLLSITGMLFAWGTWGHEHINKAAVFALPESMRVFFYNHIDYMIQESTVPDLRKYTMNDKSENPRHYIDVEAFGPNMDSLPRLSKDATVAYKDSFLRKNGILPWYIQDMMEKLTKAFKEKRKTEILFVAADLGHYMGDAYVPLHTTLNHDGQLTNQKGIHSFWESQLPEKFGQPYNFYSGDAKFIDDIPKETWRIIKDSFLAADSLLAIDRKLSSEVGQDNIFKKDESGKTAKNKFFAPVHTPEYAQKYHEALKGMIERRMRAAIGSTADFWYTAWVNAGKPDLSGLDDDELTLQNKKNYEEEYNAWKKGKLSKLKIETEF